MSTINYTPIDNLINTYQAESTGALKEAEPILKSSETTQLQEAIEHEPIKEVKSFVHPKAETIKLPPDLKMLGLQPVSNTQFQSYQNIKLPISDDKIIQGLHAPVSSSLRWLATLAVYILRLGHLRLKIVGGKVIRIFKR
jgi:hypothetical protein